MKYGKPIVVLFLLFLVGAPDAIACTQADAFNKMMALGRAQQKLMNAAGDDPEKSRHAALMTIEIADLGQTLADEKYAEACAGYDIIAQRYGVDFEKELKDMVTLADIVEDGGRNGGQCSQADASARLMTLIGVLEQRVADGDVEQAVLLQFMDETRKHNDLLMTQPSAFCAELDRLKPAYGLD